MLKIILSGPLDEYFLHKTEFTVPEDLQEL